MVLRLSLRVSWICLLLISSAACFPATKEDYRYPYTATWLANSGLAPRSLNVPSVGLLPHHKPPADLQQPAAPVQQAGSHVGSQSSSSLATGSSPSYQPNTFLVAYDSRAPVVPSGAEHVSSPVGTEKKSPSSPVQPQPADGIWMPPRPVSNFRVGYGDGSALLGSPFADSSLDWGSLPEGHVASPAVGSANNPSVWMPPHPVSDSNAGYGDGPALLGSPFADSSLDWGSLPEGHVASPSAGLVNGPSVWMPSRPFPDFGVLDSAQEMLEGVKQERPPLPPSSYIIQSRNGYQRARETFSHMKYSPEFPQLLALGSKTVSAPGSKGGKKV
ncbi:hypothetical protein PAMA_012083 [Pampus argenteus]